jgi:hypothetical protein
MATTIVWEKIGQGPQAGILERSRTPTGWLVRETQEVVQPSAASPLDSGYQWRVSLTFVPDPEHVWLKQ